MGFQEVLREGKVLVNKLGEDPPKLPASWPATPTLLLLFRGKRTWESREGKKLFKPKTQFLINFL